MKRFFFALLCLFIYISNVQAQNDTVLNVSQLIGGPPLEVCKNKYDRVVIYAVESCEDFFWYISGVTHNENPLILDQSNNYFVVYYIGCDIGVGVGSFLWGAIIAAFGFTVTFMVAIAVLVVAIVSSLLLLRTRV